MTKLSEKLPQGPMQTGEGRISAYLCFLLGALSLLGVLAFMFPSYLTTPQLREAYDPAHMRGLIAAGLIASAGFGVFSLRTKSDAVYVLTGFACCIVAMMLGGPDVAQGIIEPGALYIGLDWFIIGLLSTGAGFIILEKLVPLRPEQPILREDWLLDMKHFLFFHLAIGFFLFVANFVVHEWYSWFVIPGLGELVRSLPFPVQFFLILVVVDFAQYWVHRLYHTNGFFWRVHSVHHSAEHMDWMASSRLNFIEPMITRTLGLIGISTFGFEQGPINAYIIFIGFHATFIHANCGIDFSKIEWLFVSPKHHHWHHAKAEEAINTNFAVHLAIFDRLFGTLYLPKEWPDAYGVVGVAPPKSIVKQQLHPFAVH